MEGNANQEVTSFDEAIDRMKALADRVEEFIREERASRRKQHHAAQQTSELLLDIEREKAKVKLLTEQAAIQTALIEEAELEIKNQRKELKQSSDTLRRYKDIIRELTRQQRVAKTKLQCMWGRFGTFTFC